MITRTATQDDLPSIENILGIYHLPANDCDEHLENFIIIEDNGTTIGVGGLEICEEFGLLRSIAVIPEFTGKGIGRLIFEILENNSRNKGVKAIYLLTETAVKYFSTLGFLILERSAAPQSITKTRQFLELCPASAELMYKELNLNL